MNIEALKSRATAAEFTLIEAVETALRSSIAQEVVDELNMQLLPSMSDLVEWFKDRRYSSRVNPLQVAFDNTRKAFAPPEKP